MATGQKVVEKLRKDMAKGQKEIEKEQEADTAQKAESKV